MSPVTGTPITSTAYITQADITGLGEEFSLPAAWATADVTNLISSVSNRMDSICKDHFMPKALTLLLSGDNHPFLDFLPTTTLRCISVTSVYYRDTYAATDDFTDNGEEVEDSDWALGFGRRGLLRIHPTTVRGGRTGLAPTWLEGTKNYRVIGSFGWATVPEGIKRAAVLWCRHIISPGDKRSAMGYTVPSSEKFADGYQYATSGAAARGRAAPYYMGIPAIDDALDPYVLKMPRMVAV